MASTVYELALTISCSLIGVVTIGTIAGPDDPHRATIFTGQEVLAHEIFMRLATGSLIQIDDCDRDIGPAQGPASFKPPLPGDQTAFGSHSYWVTSGEAFDSGRNRHQAHACKSKYRGMDVSDAKKLKQLEEENRKPLRDSY
jgi:hypothetical protein